MKESRRVRIPAGTGLVGEKMNKDTYDQRLASKSSGAACGVFGWLKRSGRGDGHGDGQLAVSEDGDGQLAVSEDLLWMNLNIH
jgi:hypothetical protein